MFPIVDRDGRACPYTVMDPVPTGQHPPETRTNRGTTPSWLWDATAILLLVVLALWVDGHVFASGLDLLDEGFEYQLAHRILLGQIPYRNFFTVTTPLAFYWQALLIALFGPGLLVGRISNLLTALAITVLLYTIGRRLAGRPLALLAAAISIPWGLPYWPAPNYSWYVILLCLMAGWRALVAAEGRGRWWTAGLCAAGAVLCKQNVGLAAAFSVCLYALLRGGWPSVRGVAVGLMVPLGAFGGYMASTGAVPYFWYETVVFALGSFPHKAYVPYPALGPVLVAAAQGKLPGGVAGMHALLPLLPPLVLAVGTPLLAWGWLRHERWVPEGVLAWMLTASGWVVAFPRSDWAHLTYALPTAFVGLAWILWRLCAGRRFLLPLPIFLLLSMLAVSWPSHLGPWRQGVSVGVPRASGILVNRATATMVQQTVATIDAMVPPGQPVLILPWADMLYYLANRQNPTPYDLVIPLNMPPQGYAQIAHTLQQTHATVFFAPHEGIDGHFRVYAAAIIQQLRAHYVLSGSVGPFQIWRWSAA